MYLYIYFACALFVRLGVCLFVSNKHQNGWTDPVQFFCGTSHDPREGLWMIKITKFCFQQNSISNNIFLWNTQTFFVFVLQCIQRENVHNCFRRWERSALKAEFFCIYPYLKKPSTSLCIMQCKKLSLMEKKARDLHIKDILNILWKQNYALYFSFIF